MKKFQHRRKSFYRFSLGSKRFHFAANGFILRATRFSISTSNFLDPWQAFGRQVQPSQAGPARKQNQQLDPKMNTPIKENTTSNNENTIPPRRINMAPEEMRTGLSEFHQPRIFLGNSTTSVLKIMRFEPRKTKALRAQTLPEGPKLFPPFVHNIWSPDWGHNSPPNWGHVLEARNLIFPCDFFKKQLKLGSRFCPNLGPKILQFCIQNPIHFPSKTV